MRIAAVQGSVRDESISRQSRGPKGWLGSAAGGDVHIPVAHRRKGFSARVFATCFTWWIGEVLSKPAGFTGGFSQVCNFVMGSPAEAGSRIRSMARDHRLKSVAKRRIVSDEVP